MSELKSVYIDRTGDWCRSENNTGKFYLKSEADKVIAELKSDISDLRDNKALTDDILYERSVEIAELNEQLETKAVERYKRCLAIAKQCFTKSNYHFVLARHGEDAKKNTRRSILYTKWHRRWLDIAKKLKVGIR